MQAGLLCVIVVSDIKGAHMTLIRVGALNAQYGHPQVEHSKKIIRIFDDESLDILLITESRDYNNELATLARKKGYRLLVHKTQKGSDQCTALVRNPEKVGRSFTFQAGRGWFRRGGGAMAPMQPIAVRYENAWYVGVHAPVQAWVATRVGRKFIGPILRRTAYRGFMRRLRAFARRRQGPLVFIGDWNATPDNRGKYSPNWLREQIHGTYARPYESTGHGEIDFGIKRGMELKSKVAAYYPRDFPGDHKFIVFTEEH